nr:PocR ligand-binding domain-containing protein [Candidatus Krumholzibacteria bacterium]
MTSKKGGSTLDQQHVLATISEVTFGDLFDLADIQRLQDEFAAATGVASIITHPDGSPLTEPSRFCRLCKDVIRRTEKGQVNCFKSDAVIGRPSPDGPVIQPCISGGLWDAGAGITVGGKHVANWLIGQVRDETQTEDKMRVYAREIGADEEETVQAFKEVPSMSRQQFGNVAQVLYTMANHLSASAYQNLQQTRLIKDLRQAEDALRESEARHRRVLENILIGVVAHGPDTRIEYANQEATRILGLSQGQMRGTTALDPGWRFLREDGTEMPHDEFPANWVLSNLKPLREKVIGVDRPPNGDRAWASVNAYPEFGPGGNLQSILVTFIDISERKRYEEEKAKLEEQLRQAQKMESVGRLAGGVAHDFNNMLGVVIGNADLALDAVSADQPLHAELKEIRRAAQRSTDLTRQLLAFARQQTIAPKVVDLNEAVAGMLKMLGRLIGEDIELTWLPGEGLWRVKMDPSQIDQILANLCVNSRDAIEGVGRVTIETANKVFDETYCATHPVTSPGHFVELSLSDDGRGMERETLANLFEPFFTTKDVGKGTGLGLATVYGIVKQNNGFINVYSEIGKGTTFKVYLPRHEGDLASKSAIPASAQVQTGQETILLVEDEPTLLKITSTMLGRLGYTVLKAGSPAEAMEIAQNHESTIDLLLTDVVMPGMNGKDLAATLFDHLPELKRLFMSGYTANVIAHHGVLDEGVFFIQKPFSKQELAAKIREALAD